MNDLLTWLRVQLDEDERIAKAATPGPWWHNPTKQWLGPEAFEKYDLTQGEEFVGHGGPHPFTGAIAVTGRPSTAEAMRNAAHIALHDPARVLAEVDAKRRILDLHKPITLTRRLADGQMHDVTACDYDTNPDAPGWADWPCQMVRLLALPYANQPGYRDEWKPDTP